MGKGVTAVKHGVVTSDLPQAARGQAALRGASRPARGEPNWSWRRMGLSGELYEPLNHPSTQSPEHSRHNGGVYT